MYSDDAKHFGSHVCGNLHDPMKEMVGNVQYGAGFNGASCDIAHLHVSEPLAFAFGRNKSAGIVFLDLVTAFASLRRCLSIPGDKAGNDA